jgi:hypothetical protein
MATFTVDLLTGNIYLFSGDFTGSGSTPTSGSSYPQVNTYGDLPSAGSVGTGQIYVVRNGSGDYVLNRKPSGFYISSGSVWRFLGETPDFFKSDNFQVYDASDNTKGLEFITSGISTNIFRQLTVQDNDGTIAYLTDLDTKVNLSAFQDFTGTTAPATYLTINDFTSYTASTEATFTGYTATTLSLINAKQDQLVAGDNISIVGNVISVTGITSNSALQLQDNSGGTNVNLITPTAINWTTQVFSGTALNYTGGSRIYVGSDGIYGISYTLNVLASSSSDKNIGTLIRKNGNTDITPMSSASFSSNRQNDSSTNTMPESLVSLNNGDYIELLAFRIGYTGIVNTVAGGSWIKMEKKL